MMLAPACTDSRRDRQPAGETLVRPAGRDGADQRLARDADQQRAAQTVSVATPPAARDCAQALAEPDARIDDDAIGGDTPAARMPRYAPAGIRALPRRHPCTRGSSCMVRGSPCMCIRHIAALLRAAAASAPGSQRPHIVDHVAPACTAARMTSALLVSTETDGHRARPRLRPPAQHARFPLRPPRPRRQAASIRRHVDDARALFHHRARGRAHRRRRGILPPSENESGVTLSMPITTGRDRSRL